MIIGTALRLVIVIVRPNIIPITVQTKNSGKR